MEISVYNEQGKEVGKIEFDETLLGEKVRRKLLHQAVVRYEANKRVGTHSTKTKGERSGSGTKPWKQKHTGRARVGTKRSPLWRGGGIIFGPKPRDYRQDMPKRMRKEALKSALLSKFQDNEVKVIEDLDFKKPETKRFFKALKALGLDKKTCLVAVHEPAEDLVKSVRNIEKATILPSRNLNAYDVLKSKNLLITKSSLERLGEVVRS